MFELLDDTPRVEAPIATHQDEVEFIKGAVSGHLPVYSPYLLPFDINRRRLDETLAELDRDHATCDDEVHIANLAQFHFTPHRNAQIVSGSYAMIGTVELATEVPLAIGVAPAIDASEIDYGEFRDLARLAFDAIQQPFNIDGGGDGMDYIMSTPNLQAHISILVDGALDTRGGYRGPKLWFDARNPDLGIRLINQYSELLNLALEDKLRHKMSIAYFLDGLSLPLNTIHTSYTRRGCEKLGIPH